MCIFEQKAPVVYLSIGSNLGDRLLQLQLAVGMIVYRIGELKTISKVIETPAWGFDGEAFYNMCLGVKTALSPEDVLQQLLEIEQFLGRKRNQQQGYQSRIIDLDIVFYKDVVLETPLLTLPHPRMEERNFVLAPLAEIAPNHLHPKRKKTVQQLLQNSKDHTEVNLIEASIFQVKAKKFIAIEGNIGAGKTTFAHQLKQALGGCLLLENFYKNPYLEDFYRDPKTFALLVEQAFLDERIQQQNSFFNSEKSQPFIADYCMEKSMLFAEQNLDKKDFEEYRNDFQKKATSLPQPDVVFYLVQSIAQLQYNIKKRGRVFEQNISKSYLQKIEKNYSRWYKESKLNIVRFSLEGKDFTQDSIAFYRFLLALFRL